MTCVKTGAQVYLAERMEFAWCDAHFFPGAATKATGVFLFRISHVGREPISPQLHFTVDRIATWFDQNTQVASLHPSTLVALGPYITEHGYEGVPVEIALTGHSPKPPIPSESPE